MKCERWHDSSAHPPPVPARPHGKLLTRSARRTAKNCNNGLRQRSNAKAQGHATSRRHVARGLPIRSTQGQKHAPPKRQSAKAPKRQSAKAPGKTKQSSACCAVAVNPKKQLPFFAVLRGLRVSSALCFVVLRGASWANAVAVQTSRGGILRPGFRLLACAVRRRGTYRDFLLR